MAGVEVMLLGPPRVLRGGEPVAFDTRKAVALLAHLALADRPRPRDVLAELLWPEHDAEHARGALRRTLSTLRGAIGAEALDATRDLVSLVRSPGIEVDVERFRALAAAGSVEAAAAAYRGDFLEGFGLRDAPEFEDWQRGEAEGLRRELAAVLARLAEEREAAGDPAAALPHARRRLELDELHEPAHRALIRLLALTGDRAGALAQYRECVRTLSRELGVPPLEETTRLYEAISDGTFAAPPPAGAAPLSSPPGAAPLSPPSGAAPLSPPSGAAPPAPLVGRDHDWRALLAAYDAVGADGRVAIVEGEAGIGKTRLAEELLAHAADRGARTLAGRAYEEESALAYGPLVEALRARLRHDRDWLAGVPEPALAEAARLVPDVAAPPPPLDGPGAQARFLEGLWQTLVGAAAGPVPGVLLVDDAQWADEATLALLAYGLRRLAGRPLLVVLTWRTPHDHPLRRFGGATRRRLERLGREDVQALLPEAAPAELGARLYAETEGLPFLLVEYLNALREPAGDPWSLPAGARSLLRARLDPVTQTGRQVLAAAAVIGRSFDVETVRDASGRGEEETVGALEELVVRGLIREGEADYDFGHEQIRALVYEETSLARRRLLHARAAEALGAAGREGASRSAAVARHLRLAGRDAGAAREYVRAAEHARAVHANAQALEHVRAALSLGHPDRSALHAAAGDLQTLLGDYPAALASYETAAERGGASVGPEADRSPQDLAGLEHRLGRLHHRRGEWALAQAHLQAALDAAAPDDVAARATICADLSLSAHDGGDPERAARLALEARELAERAGDAAALGQALNLLGLLATGRGAVSEALGHLERSLALAEQRGDIGARAAALNNLALARRARGELEPALELTRAALELCEAQGDRHREAALRNNLADLLHEAGRPEDAMEQLKRAVALFAEIGEAGAAEPQPRVWMLARW
jgi:DNA-binding SARP family transcriptional activator/tetratricopeptide (TPR) repeat protein